jgi:hypothetical protein
MRKKCTWIEMDLYEWNDEWADEWMDEWIDKWKDGCI